jgi:glycosyltransferase involved in cell wall biosynthesis
MTDKKISLVIPVHNEAEIIGDVIKNYYEEVISKIPGSEFIIAEDGSTDGTKEILKKIAEVIPIKLILSDQRKGYAMAVWDAFKLAENDIVFFSDSDGQHSPADFWKMIPFIEDFDIITGYKYPRKDSLFRRVISFIMNHIVWMLFGILLHDINCGFRVMKKEVVNSVLKDRMISDFISTEFVIRVHQKGYRVVEIPVRHYSRPFGDSKWLSPLKLPKIIGKLLLNLLTIRVEFWIKKLKRK